jgi:phosphonate transport system ATP-binding protein
VQKSPLILADEPIASLDPESSIKVMELLRRLNQEDGLTIVVSLHQIDYATRYCPRAVALHLGRIGYDGPSEGLTKSMMRSIYGERAAAVFDGGRTLGGREARPAKEGPAISAAIADGAPRLAGGFGDGGPRLSA